MSAADDLTPTGTTAEALAATVPELLARIERPEAALKMIADAIPEEHDGYDCNGCVICAKVATRALRPLDGL